MLDLIRTGALVMCLTIDRLRFMTVGLAFSALDVLAMSQFKIIATHDSLYEPID